MRQYAGHGGCRSSSRPMVVRRNAEAGVFDIVKACCFSTSTLTACVVDEDGKPRLEPLSFRTTFRLPFYRDFSYDPDQPDAYIVRLMTCWLEATFLQDHVAILEQIRAVSPDMSVL